MFKQSKWMAPLGAAVSLLLLGPGLVSTLRGATDFIDLYAGAKLAFTQDQYNVARVLATEAHFTGFSSPTRLFMRLPVFGALLWPVAQMPYSLASPLWEALCAAALTCFAVLWPARRAWTITACCWSLPLWMTLAEGQDTAFLLLWLALAVVALRREKPLWCGVVLSLCAAKYHLFLLLPLWIISNRLWRVGAGLCMGGALLIAGSFIAGGPHWPQHYIELLREPSHNPFVDLMPNLYSLTPHAPSFEFAACVLVSVLVWFAARHLDVSPYGASASARAYGGLAPVLLGGVIVSRHDYMADCVLFLPAVLLLLKQEQPILQRVALVQKVALVYLLTPVPYIALMLHATWMVVVPVLLVITLLAFSRQSALATPLQSERYPSDVAAAVAHFPAQ